MKKIKIAVTGGPSGGKTSLIETIRKGMGHECAVVPEAASILFRGGFPRSNDPDFVIHTQRAIYYVQRELEEVMFHHTSSRLVICDRGSLDGLAYWPNRSDGFFKSLSTSREAELSRYDWVIHLDTANKSHYEISNPTRVESFEEAKKLNDKILKAWSTHPRRLIVRHNDSFLSKLTLCLEIISGILAGEKYETLKRYSSGP
jgi:predicted ATPase